MRRRAFIAAFGSSGCEVYLLVLLHADASPSTASEVSSLSRAMRSFSSDEIRARRRPYPSRRMVLDGLANLELVRHS